MYRIQQIFGALHGSRIELGLRNRHLNFTTLRSAFELTMGEELSKRWSLA